MNTKIIAVVIILFLLNMISSVSIADLQKSNAPALDDVGANDLVFIDLKKDVDRLTMGFGASGVPFLGSVRKDGFGYLKCENGLNWMFGYTYSWFFGYPSNSELNVLFEQIKAEKGVGNIDPKDIRPLITAKKDNTSYNYVSVGTVVLFLPYIEAGRIWALGEHGRLRIGIAAVEKLRWSSSDPGGVVVTPTLGLSYNF